MNSIRTVKSIVDWEVEDFKENYPAYHDAYVKVGLDYRNIPGGVEPGIGPLIVASSVPQLAEKVVDALAAYGISARGTGSCCPFPLW